MPELSRRVGEFTDSVIRRMTRISDGCPGSINLSQGFPDFDPPKELLDALAEAAYKGPHQYSITFGAENFREALAKKAEKAIKRKIDPEKEIVVLANAYRRADDDHKNIVWSVLDSYLTPEEKTYVLQMLQGDASSQVG